MKQRGGWVRYFNVFISFLCLAIWLCAFLRFIRISLPAGNAFSDALLEKAGIENGEITFSVYQLFRMLLTIEDEWSMVGTPAREIYILIVLIAVPYVFTLAAAVLIWFRGNWKYAVTAGLSMAALAGTIYEVIVKLPETLGDYLEELLGGNVLWLLELALDEPLSDFLQRNIISYLREGFWFSIVLLALIYLMSAVVFTASWRGRTY